MDVVPFHQRAFLVCVGRCYNEHRSDCQSLFSADIVVIVQPTLRIDGAPNVKVGRRSLGLVKSVDVKDVFFVTDERHLFYYTTSLPQLLGASRSPPLATPYPTPRSSRLGDPGRAKKRPITTRPTLRRSQDRPESLSLYGCPADRLARSIHSQSSPTVRTARRRRCQ